MPSLPHIDMSVAMLRAAGVEVDDAEPEHLARSRPGAIAGRDWTVEPDLSNAAVFLAAAAVTGGEVTRRRLARALDPAGRRDPAGARAVRRLGRARSGRV